MFISMQYRFTTGEGRHQHEQRGFREVKICQHAAHDAELEPGIDEDVGFATLRRDATGGVLPSGKFERADRRGSDCKHASAAITRFLDSLRGRLRYPIPLAMELVFLYHHLAHRLKRSQPHVQRDLSRFDAASANAAEDLGCEVQARGRCGNGAEWLGVNGLVLLAIFQRVWAIDIRRQRYVPNPLQYAEEILDRIKAEMALAERAAPDDLGREIVRIMAGFSAEINSFADPQFSSGMH